MALVELGVLLREEREKRGLTVEDVASHLKMSPRLIRDMESGNESALPPVYVRGFIRSYAKFLHVNPEALEEQLGDFGQDEQELVHQEPAQGARPGKGFGLKLLVLLCALGFAGYWYYAHVNPGTAVFSSLLDRAGSLAGSVTRTFSGQGEGSGSPAVPPQAPGAARHAPDGPEGRSTPAPDAGTGPESAGALQSPGAAPDQPAAEPLVEPAPDPDDDEDDAPLEIVPPSEQSFSGQSFLDEDDAADVGAPALASQVPVDETEPVRAEGFSPPRGELPATGTGRGEAVGVGIRQAESTRTNQLVLTGLAECWVHATADETDTRQFSIMPGETFSLSFRQALVLKLGNAGGVRLTYNGVEQPAPGSDGQVITMAFPDDARR